MKHEKLRGAGCEEEYFTCEADADEHGAITCALCDAVYCLTDEEEVAKHRVTVCEGCGEEVADCKEDDE